MRLTSEKLRQPQTSTLNAVEKEYRTLVRLVCSDF